MRDDDLLQRIGRMLELERVRIVAHLVETIHETRNQIMSTLSDDIAAATASNATLTALVTELTTKVDALIVLAQSSGASNDDINAILALKASTDAANAAITAEAAKVDAELNPAPAPVAQPADGGGPGTVVTPG